MTLEGNNKAVIGLLLVLVVGAASFMWWSKMYKPAVAERLVAVQATAAKQQELETARAALATAQQQEQAQKTDTGKVDDAVPRVTIARNAIPSTADLGDAMIVLSRIADRSGITTNIDAGSDNSTETPGNAGVTPIDVTFKAAGTYTEMTAFIQRVQGTVTIDKSKLHVKGRLFNVVSLEIADAGLAKSSTGNVINDFGSDVPSSSDVPELSDELVTAKGDKLFTVVIRFYSAASTAPANTAGGDASQPIAGDQAQAGAVTDGSQQPTATTDSPTAGTTGAATAPAGAAPVTDTTGAAAAAGTAGGPTQ